MASADGERNDTDLGRLRQACRDGDRAAMVQTACLLRECGKDLDEAGGWIQRAAELGEPEAQNRLAAMLTAEQPVDRLGVFPNRDEAATWLAVALSRSLPTNLREMAEHHPAAPEAHAAFLRAMDEALARLHREGRIGWWPGESCGPAG